MPHFQVHGPDGSIYEVDGPEGSDEAAAIAYVQANQKTIPSAPGPAAPHAAAPGLGAIVHGYLSTLQGAADTVGRIMSDPSGGALRGAIGGGIDAVTGQPQGQTLQATGAAAQTGVGQLLRMPADVANLWQHRLDPGVGDGGSLYEMSGQAAEPHTVADLVAGHPLPASHADDYQATPLAAQLIARGKAAAPAKPGLGSQIAAGAVGLAPYVAAGSIPLVGPGLAAGMMAGSGVTDQAEKAEALGKAGTPQAYNAEGNNAIVQGGLGAIPLGSLGEALIPQVVREAVTSLAQKAGVKSLPGWLASAQAELLPGVLAGGASELRGGAGAAGHIARVRLGSRGGVRLAVAVFRVPRGLAHFRRKLRALRLIGSDGVK